MDSLLGSFRVFSLEIVVKRYNNRRRDEFHPFKDGNEGGAKKQTQISSDGTENVSDFHAMMLRYALVQKSVQIDIYHGSLVKYEASVSFSILKSIVWLFFLFSIFLPACPPLLSLFSLVIFHSPHP